MKFVRISNLDLLDHNERDRYGEAVADDEVLGCDVARVNGLVDCVADCNNGVVGVDFTSWTGKGSIKRARKELKRKLIENRMCGEGGCKLVVGVASERLYNALEEIRSEFRGLGVAYVSEDNLGRLKGLLCGGGVEVVVLGLGSRGVASCGG
ncbi:MAG: hypothetical protein ACPL3C_11750 [Pyrobaculum sp.]